MANPGDLVRMILTKEYGILIQQYPPSGVWTILVKGKLQLYFPENFVTIENPFSKIKEK